MTMPPYLTDHNFWTAIWPLLLTPVIVAIIVSLALANPFRRPARFRLFALVAFSLSMLGIVTGNLTGLSRDPTVGTVIPAVLALVGGMTVYVVGKEGRLAQFSVCIGVVALSFSMLVGVYWGARSRIVHEFEREIRGPEFSRPAELAKEDTALAVALVRLRNEIQFIKIRSALEKQYGTKLETQFGGMPRSEQPIDNPK